MKSNASCSWRFQFLLILGWLGGPAASAGAASAHSILVVTNAANPFSQYYAEILHTEGLNEFDLLNASSVSNSALAPYDVVLLGQTPLSSQQVSILSNWVSGGGILIAMRPDKQLAGLLGLNDTGSTLSEGYLLVNHATVPGAGIVDQTMQFHGTADRYTLGGASSLAVLYTNAVTATVNPAVSVRSVGSNGGQAAAFIFDLARSVVYTRQGNPAWSGQERDGLHPIRSDDLFYGAASFDPEPDWIDLNKVAIPQADEQQRLLANMILAMEFNKKPLPRFWYLPHGYKAVIVMTGDDHANGGTAGRFDQYIADSPTNASVADWTAIRSTSYIYPNPALTDAQAAFYNAQGFEIALHLNTGCGDYTPSSLDAMFTDQLNQFTSDYPSLPPMVTHRIHCVAWSDYSSLPQDELLHGIRLDVSYYYWPPGWVLDRPGLFTGSAMPMRLASANGNTIDVFEAPSQMTDESGQSFPYTVDTLLDRALGPEECYGVYVANMHTDYVQSDGSDAIIASAISRGVPVIAARQLLTWLDSRNGSSFGSVDLIGDTLTFSVTADANARALQGMVPIPVGYSVTNLSFNGSPTNYFLRGVNGLQYAFFNAQSGNYQVNLAPDTVPPGITSVQPANGATAVSWATPLIISFNEALDPATVGTNTISLRDSANNLVPAAVSYNSCTFVATLTPSGPLSLATTYTATLKGGADGITDAASNALANDFVWSFATTNSISIWDNSAVPALASSSDASSIEVGTRFESALDGTVVGIRFYKGAANPGPHVGNLWTADGTLLSSVTFSNETASGWQYQALPTPIPIVASNLYVVSYHAPHGGYAADSGYFAGKSVDSYPLRALADGESGGNGLYAYGPSAFPNLTFDSENYWVDLVFQPGTAPLSISTGSLPGGAPGAPYSATLTAVSGVAPCFWSIASGSLPPGLMLDTNTGVISGASTNVGTFDFTARVTDSSSPAESATRPLSITIAPPPDFVTIWPSSAEPGLLDAGPDSSVEVGLKFRSDVAGNVTGVRFYKSSANTGTHVGNLWTSNGTLLASATFTNETASGWQQVNFPAPVHVNSNTVYVASYHASNGHYNADANYFASSGVDNPPLHALASGVSGGNGIYAYGSGTTFPNQTYGAANYWVDVAFKPNASQALVAISISPNNATLSTGDSLAFTAIGTYSDTSTQDITGLVTWGSTETAVAIVDSAGLATAFAPGATTISATLAGVSATTALNVEPGPLSIATTSLPNGFQNTAYAATLTASGGTLPCQWSVINGLLPAGLTLNANTGALTGTPTGTGIFSFTVQVTDSGSPIQSSSSPLSLTINSLPTGFTLWPSSAMPGIVDAGPDPNPVELGVRFKSDIPGYVSAIRFYKAPANTGPHVGNLWASDGTLLASATFANESSSGWQQANFLSPVPIASNTVYVASYHANYGHYSADLNYFSAAGLDNPPLHAPADGSGGGNGVYAYGASSSFPNQIWNAANYWVDVVLTIGAGTGTFLPPQTDRTINELTALVVTNSAIDTNLVYYRLVDPPAGAQIDTDGIISWTPTEAQGPGTYTITTVVTDDGIPPLSATNSFEVTVSEVNAAPLLPAQTNQTMLELTTLLVTNTATDSDVPANALSYELVSPPAGAQIDTDGIISWTPTEAQAGRTNLFTTVVTDNGLPSLSATNLFLVVVNPLLLIPPPLIQSIALSNQVVTITWTSVSNGVYRLQYSEDLTDTNWTDVLPDSQGSDSSLSATNTVGTANQRYYRILVVPAP